MGETSLKHHPKARLDEKADRALASAAGALTHAEGVDVLLGVPDAELGRILKLRIYAFRRLLLPLSQPSAKGNPKKGLVEKVRLDAMPLSTATTEEALPRDEWKQKAAEARRTLLKKKELISTGDLRAALDVTRQAVSAAARSSRIFTVEVDGETYFPAFFVDGKVDRVTLEKVSKRLGKLPGWTKWDFFTSPKGSLGGISPLEALHKGKVDEVLRITSAFVEEREI